MDIQVAQEVQIIVPHATPNWHIINCIIN